MSQLPDVQFDRAAARLYTSDRWRMTCYARFVEGTPDITLAIACESGEKQITGAFYAIYDPRSAPKPPFVCLNVVAAAAFEAGHVKIDDMPDLWRQRPIAAQQVSTDQIRGTSGYVVTMVNIADGKPVRQGVTVGDWLILHHDERVQVMSRGLFRAEFSRTG